MRIIAIDWSGAKSGERSKIWLAEIRGEELTRLECGRSRDEVIAHVVADADRKPDLLVGLDFAFSFPEWFLAQRGMTSVEALWSEVGRHGEDRLACCDTPFWGRPGKKKPDLPSHLRATEVSASVAGIGAKSVFQIGGAGAVGTGSLRGMRYLETLHSAGFAIWPFHEVRLPLVIEIYPRLLTGPVKKSSQVDRERYLASGFPEIRAEDAYGGSLRGCVRCRDLGGRHGAASRVDHAAGACEQRDDAAGGADLVTGGGGADAVAGSIADERWRLLLLRVGWPAGGGRVGRPHAHVHVIPRFEGDVPDPRGGIRWVLPEQAPCRSG